MSAIAHVNGRYLPAAQATLPIDDRGLQFADAIYEVVKLMAGRLVDAERHLDRLERSLAAIRIPMPMSRAALLQVIARTVALNHRKDALVYLQVSRGTAPRNHPFPTAPVRPNLIVTARRLKLPSAKEEAEGCQVILLPDQRWGRCDIKSTGLLANVLAKQAATEAGVREAWLVDAAGRITEGSSTNAWIVDAEGVLRTRPLGPEILGGVTRSVVVDLARALGIPLEEKAFSLDELAGAREAFLTSATSLVLPVTVVAGRPVANGMPGSLTTRLLAAYRAHCAGGKVS